MEDVMSITKEEKIEIVENFGEGDKDTGSPEVQVAILSNRISYLTDHFKVHKKDYHSRRGLLRIIARRRKLLSYLKRKNAERYRTLIGRLGIKR